MQLSYFNFIHLCNGQPFFAKEGYSFTLYPIVEGLSSRIDITLPNGSVNSGEYKIHVTGDDWAIIILGTEYVVSDILYSEAGLIKSFRLTDRNGNAKDFSVNT